jgi:hypothetical protein
MSGEPGGTFTGQVVGDGHCVAYVRAALDLPHTSTWRRGVRVRGGNVEPGTGIATFNGAGRYANAVDGSSHAAVLVAETSAGLVVTDQWVGHPVAERTIRYKGGVGAPVNDGDAFYCITVVAGAGA